MTHNIVQTYKGCKCSEDFSFRQRINRCSDGSSAIWESGFHCEAAFESLSIRTGLSVNVKEFVQCCISEDFEITAKKILIKLINSQIVESMPQLSKISLSYLN